MRLLQARFGFPIRRWLAVFWRVTAGVWGVVAQWLAA